MTIELLLATRDLEPFIDDSRRFIAESYPGNISDAWSAFCKQLKSIATEELSATEKLILAKLALTCLNRGINGNQLDQLITAAIQIKCLFGPLCYYSVLTASVPDAERCITHYLKLYQLIESLKDEAPINQILMDFNQVISSPKFGGSLVKLLESLCVDQMKKFRQTYPSRPLEDVMAAFNRVDEHLQYPIDPLELKDISDEFRAIDALKENFVGLTLDELCANIQAHAKSLKAEPKLRSAKVQVLASLRELIRRHFHILPHDTQMMAILGILQKPDSLRGRIAQVKTGEGKSTLVAILSAYMAAQGQFVDIVSSNEYLARRDAAKYKTFYASMGLSSSDICSGSPKKEDFNAHILFATVSDIKFSILNDHLHQLGHRYSTTLEGVLVPRSLDVVIADEIDTLVDTALNAAYIAVDSPEDHRWVYEPILSVVKTLVSPFLLDSDIERLREALKRVHHGRYHDEAVGFTKERLIKWIQAAKAALQYSEHTHYVIEPTRRLTSRGYVDVPTVKIVDHVNTGRISEGCRWTGGIHEFVEVKHGIQPDRERHTAASLSHPSLFNGYQTLFGLTGTMGGDVVRAEVREIFEVDSFDVPPHIPNKRINLGLKVLDDQVQQFEAIYQVLFAKTKIQFNYLSLFSSIETRSPIETRKSCLVLFNTIRDTMAFATFLSAKKLPFQLLNERQDESEDEVIKRAAYPGAITVATNMAGRGTDILAKELHVIFADFASNDRVEAQGNGRSARQGKDGSCEAILSIKSTGLLSLCTEAELVSKKKSLAPAEFGTFLYETREKRTRLESEQRQKSLDIEAFCYSKLDAFFKRLKKVHSDFESAEIKASLIAACEGFSPSLEDSEAELDEAFDSVVAYAKTLIAQKGSSASIDWNSLIKQYKAIFVEQLIQKWAVFYTQLRDYQHEHISVAKAKIEADYGRLQSELVAFDIEKCFKIILAYTQLVPVMSKETVMVRAANEADMSTDPAYADRLAAKYTLGPTAGLADILYKAAASGDKRDVAFLLAAGVDIDAQDQTQSKKTALHLATQHGHDVVVQLLVSAGADLTIKDACHKKAEAYATKPGIIRALTKGSLEMSFFAASTEEPARRIQQILRQYQTVEIKGPTLEQLFYDAVESGADEEVFRLLKTGVNINQINPLTQRAPLHAAIVNGHLTTVRLLLAANAMAIADGHGKTMDDYFSSSSLEGMQVFSAQRQHNAIVNILRKYKSYMVPKSHDHSVRKAAIVGNEEDILVVLGTTRTSSPGLAAMMNSQDDETKKTALHLAIENGHVNAARLLIQKGAAMDIKDAADKTALDYLVASGLEQMQALVFPAETVDSILARYTVTTVTEPSLAEVLHKIAQAGEDDHLNVLIEFSDVDLDVQDKRTKKTALHIAVEHNRFSIAARLISMGARIDIKDNIGRVPADYLRPDSSGDFQFLFRKKPGLVS